MRQRPVYIYLLCVCFAYGCVQNKQTSNLDSDIKNDTTVNTNKSAEDDTTDLETNSDANSDLINSQHFELNKIYTDTVVFEQYMDYGDFDRFHVMARGKNLYPINNGDDRSLNRGDIAILEWGVDSIWIPEAPNDKWLSEYSKNIRKIKDGKLSLYKKKYPQPISYHYDDDINDKYTKEDFSEIYDLVQYYLANTKNSLAISDIESQSDSLKIQYSIEEQERVENGNKVTYTVIGLSVYFEYHDSIFQWLYLKQNDYGYRDIYEYDLPNDTLILFN